MLEILIRRVNFIVFFYVVNIKIVMGVGIEIMELEFRVVIEIIVNRESIMFFRYRRVEIR